MNTLNIEIPEGKEIDWQESAKQEKIVFKDKCFKNYQDIKKALAKMSRPNTAYAIRPGEFVSDVYFSQIEAKIKLANTCHVLNNGWSPKIDEIVYYLRYDIRNNRVIIDTINSTYSKGRFCFKTKELAEQAITILGKETIILATYDIW